MDKQINWKTTLVSFICLIGASLGGYFLYLDLNEVGVAGLGKPIGIVQFRDSQVRRKSANSYVWTHVQVGESLYKRDSIRTGIGSAVSVKLDGSSVLDVGENSLVVMDSTENLSLNFLRGSMVVHKADGDSKFSIGQDGKAKVEALPARLIMPSAQARFYVANEGLRFLTLTWEPRTPGLEFSFTVQVSTDRKFNPQLTRTLKPQNASRNTRIQTASESLGPGKYYWRVLNGGAPLTETRMFSVLRASPLQPIWPANQVKITGLVGDNAVQFRWLSPKASGYEEVDTSLGEHRIEVSRDSEFKMIVLTDSVNPSTGTAKIQGLPDGIIFWRLKSNYGDFSSTSSIKEFEFLKLSKSVQEAKAAGLPSRLPAALPTVLPSILPSGVPSILPSVVPSVQPSVLPSVVPTDLPVSSSVLPESGKVFNPLDEKIPLELSWSEVPGADAYIVTIYQEGQGGAEKKLVLRKHTDKTHQSLKGIGLGTYLWTISAVDSGKHPGMALPLRKFSINYGKILSSPQVVSPEVQ